MEPARPTDYVVSTYEEIRARFGLGGTDQARIKAKRRRWPHEPPNHPGAVARVRVPREAWDAAEAERERSRGIDPDRSLGALSHTIKVLEGEASALREALSRERERADRAETRAETAKREREEARIQAAAAGGEAQALRERVQAVEGRAAAEAARAAAAERAEGEARRERDVARGELDGFRRLPWWRRALFRP